jgi:hypothetical protein
MIDKKYRHKEQVFVQGIAWRKNNRYSSRNDDRKAIITV